MVYDIKNYNAVGDGATMNTAAIQSVIDLCYENGGGTVLISHGVYKTGSITLKSNVNLHIDATGVLLGSERCEDYPEKVGLKHVDSDCLPRFRNACLIFAEEEQNISITGMGKIDCNGTNFVVKRQGDWKCWEYERIDAPTPPRVVFFTGCKNVKIEDVTMVNQPAGWSYWIHDCDYVSFDRCIIDADVRYPNNDGIHINSSRNVTISNCNISCGDDCIIVRANNRSLKENKVCEKVSVTGCNLTSWSGGIRIGWTSDGIIRNCTFSGISMNDTSVGIHILLPEAKWCTTGDYGREKTLIENLNFDNIVMDGIYGRPVSITIVQSDDRCEAIRNINFSNIISRGLEFPLLNGKKDCKLKNIVFNNCRFTKVGEDVLPDYEHHGAAESGRKKNAQMLEYVENIVFNNTVFSEEC
ncbi:MAG: glycosyl hydrolase family 28 protein [Acutalibacteraceae bacterium]|nr:glycosyl hydrolase family 28 protein [Acutalibacteraceae bacterium]